MLKFIYWIISTTSRFLFGTGAAFRLLLQMINYTRALFKSNHSSHYNFYSCFSFSFILVFLFCYILPDSTKFEFLYLELFRLREYTYSGSLFLIKVAVGFFIVCIYALYEEVLYLKFIFILTFFFIIFLFLFSSTFSPVSAASGIFHRREVTILPPILEIPETPNPLDPDNIFGLQ